MKQISKDQIPFSAQIRLEHEIKYIINNERILMGLNEATEEQMENEVNLFYMVNMFFTENGQYFYCKPKLIFSPPLK